MLLFVWPEGHLACSKSCSNNPKRLTFEGTNQIWGNCGKGGQLKQVQIYYNQNWRMLLHIHQTDAVCAITRRQYFLCEMMSWPPCWMYEVTSKIRRLLSMCIYYCAKFIPIRFERWSLGLLWRGRPQQEEEQQQQDGSNMRSVLDPKIKIISSILHNPVVRSLITHTKKLQ